MMKNFGFAFTKVFICLYNDIFKIIDAVSRIEMWYLDDIKQFSRLVVSCDQSLILKIKNGNEQHWSTQKKVIKNAKVLYVQRETQAKSHLDIKGTKLSEEEM